MATYFQPSEPNVQISVRLPASLKFAITKIAEKWGQGDRSVSFNDVVVRFLEVGAQGAIAEIDGASPGGGIEETITREFDAQFGTYQSKPGWEVRPRIGTVRMRGTSGKLLFPGAGALAPSKKKKSPAKVRSKR